MKAELDDSENFQPSQIAKDSTVKRFTLPRENAKDSGVEVVNQNNKLNGKQQISLHLLTATVNSRGKKKHSLTYVPFFPMEEHQESQVDTGQTKRITSLSKSPDKYRLLSIYETLSQEVGRQPKPPIMRFQCRSLGIFSTEASD